MAGFVLCLFFALDSWLSSVRERTSVHRSVYQQQFDAPGNRLSACERTRKALEQQLRYTRADMIARLVLAALVPRALGDYSYSYETEAPSAAPTSSMAPTRTETYAPTRMTDAPSYPVLPPPVVVVRWTRSPSHSPSHPSHPLPVPAFPS